MLRTAVIGAGSLGRQHARIHATLAAEGASKFVSVCDLNEETARSISSERKTDWTTNWRDLIGHIDAFIAAYNQTAKPFVWTKAKVHQKRLKPVPRINDSGY